MAIATLLTSTVVETVTTAVSVTEANKNAAIDAKNAAEAALASMSGIADTASDEADRARDEADRAATYAQLSLVSDYGTLDGASATTFDYGTL
jgi:hypothetical protein